MLRTSIRKGEDETEALQYQNQAPTTRGVKTRAMTRKLELEQEKESSETVGNDDRKEDVGISREEFQWILKERKDELKRTAEIKRLEGLERIRERKSRTGVQPLDHFPKEVWCLILDEVTPSDKANLWQVHQLFPDMMRKNQIRDILLPLILDHKMGFIQKYLNDSRSRSMLLELRSVSKSMRNAVDKWFEDDLLTFINRRTETAWCNYIFWDSYPSPIRFKMSYDEGKLQKILGIEKSMKIFKRDILVIGPTHVLRGRLPEKDVRLRCFNLFVANVTKALEQVGDQIWRFQFYCEDIQRFGVSLKRICSILIDWFRHLPNLKMINLEFNAFGRNRNLHLEAESIDNFPSWSEGFPTLQGLKRLDLHSYQEDQTVKLIADAMISKNPQIKMINFNKFSKYRIISRPPTTSLNLELCQLVILDCPIIFKNIETTVGQFNWNFKMLELYFLGTCVSLNSLIRLLNIFPTLESVFLYNYTVKFSDDEIDFLRLPNLTRFGIEFVKVDGNGRKYDRLAHFFFSLQFLLHSSKLQSLLWNDKSSSPKSGLSRSLYCKIQSYEMEHPEEMLDFSGGFNDLQDSILWKAFPNLQYVKVRIRGVHVDRTFRKSRGILPFH